MLFNVRTSFIVRLALFPALLGAMLGVISVQAADDTSASAIISAGETVRVSVNSQAVQADGDSILPSISADGRYIAFMSSATNLVSGDSNGMSDIFVYNTQTTVTTRVSVSSNGAQANDASGLPSVSADGRYIAFSSSAKNLVLDDTNGMDDIFVHDMQTGTTTRISVDSNGGQASGNSEYPSISSDGRYIAFNSSATNLVPGDTNGWEDIFVHDMQTGITTRASVTSNGEQADQASTYETISGDGRYIAFHSAATNLVPGDTNGAYDIFVHDMQMGMTTRISIDSNGSQANGQSYYPFISANGQYVSFHSVASNLVSNDTNGTYDVFVHDMQTGTTARVSVDSNGGEATASSFDSSMSADGRYVAFYSFASNLVPGDTNIMNDIFVHDIQTGATTRVSVDSYGRQANDNSQYPILSGDGNSIAFTSYATNLVTGDTNSVPDIFVHRQGTFVPPTPTSTSINISTNTPTATSTPTPTWSSSSPLFQPYIKYPTGQSPQAVGVGDFNNDGLKDVAMTSTGQLLIFLQKSDGSLANPVGYATLDAGGSAFSLAVGDLNNDARADVVITDGNTIGVYLQQLDGTLAPRVNYPTSYTPDAVAVGDVNSDGLADVAVSHWNAENIGIFLQNINGTLNPMIAYASPQAGYDDIAIGDVNNDGRNDVVKMNGQLYVNPNLSVYLQNASGSLASPVPYFLGCNCLGHGISIGDVTGDNRADVVMSYGGNRPDSQIAVFAQGTNGLSPIPASYPAYDIPEPVEIADVNADGLADVLSAHGGWAKMSVLPQQAGGVLGTYLLYPVSSASHYKPEGLAVGDINHDGFPDVVIADPSNGLIVLYHNWMPSTPTPTSTFTQTPTPTFTPTGTATFTPIYTPTSTFTPTATPPYSYNPLYISLTGSQTIGGVSSANEDILKFDGKNWSLFFDGSDVGLSSLNLFGFSIMDADTILMSFNSAVTLNGIAFTPQDVARFDATSLGSTTAGTFSMYFDGSDVGLDTSGESIDSLSLLPDGRLLISTTGNPSVPGLSGLADEDVLAFTPTTLGDTTSGSWSLYFDGSDVGLADSSNEDVDALDVTSNGNIYLSTLGDFAVNGVSGADEDVFVCAPTSIGATTACNYSPTLYFDGSIWGLANNDVDGFNFLATEPIPTVVPSNTPTITPTRTNTPFITNTPTWTPSPMPTFTQTTTSTVGPSPTNTPLVTNTPTRTPSPTATFTPSATNTATATGTLTLSFAPIDDAYIASGSPSTNYASVTSLQVDNSPIKHILIKFTVSGLSGKQVSSAKLRFYNVDPSSKGGDFYPVSDNSWQEGTVTWANAPAAQTNLLASLGSVSPGNWYEVDLTSLITGDGTYSLRISSTSSDGADYSSKEGANPPQLVITVH